MISFEHAARFSSLRNRVMRCVEEELQRDNMHKSYEGVMSVSMDFPDYFAGTDVPTWAISLNAYVLPVEGRHARFEGSTFADALAKAEQTIGKMCEQYEFARFCKRMGETDNCDEPHETVGDSTVYGPNRHEKDEHPF